MSADIADSFEGLALLGFADAATTNPNATVPLWAGLDANGDPRAGTRPADAVDIYIDHYPEAIDSVTITDYTVDDDPDLSESTLGIQVTIKSKSRATVKAIQADLFDLFQGRWGGMLGAVRLVNARRTSGTGLGIDSDERQGRTESYYLRLHRPSTNRT